MSHQYRSTRRRRVFLRQRLCLTFYIYVIAASMVAFMHSCSAAHACSSAANGDNNDGIDADGIQLSSRTLSSSLQSSSPVAEVWIREGEGKEKEREGGGGPYIFSTSASSTLLISHISRLSEMRRSALFLARYMAAATTAPLTCYYSVLIHVERAGGRYFAVAPHMYTEIFNHSFMADMSNAAFAFINVSDATMRGGWRLMATPGRMFQLFFPHGACPPQNISAPSTTTTTTQAPPKGGYEVKEEYSDNTRETRENFVQVFSIEKVFNGHQSVVAVYFSITTTLSSLADWTRTATRMKATALGPAKTNNSNDDTRHSGIVVSRQQSETQKEEMEHADMAETMTTRMASSFSFLSSATAQHLAGSLTSEPGRSCATCEADRMDDGGGDEEGDPHNPKSNYVSPPPYNETLGYITFRLSDNVFPVISRNVLHALTRRNFHSNVLVSNVFPGITLTQIYQILTVLGVSHQYKPTSQVNRSIVYETFQPALVNLLLTHYAKPAAVGCHSVTCAMGIVCLIISVMLVVGAALACLVQYCMRRSREKSDAHRLLRQLDFSTEEYECGGNKSAAKFSHKGGGGTTTTNNNNRKHDHRFATHQRQTTTTAAASDKDDDNGMHETFLPHAASSMNLATLRAQQAMRSNYNIMNNSTATITTAAAASTSCCSSSLLTHTAGNASNRCELGAPNASSYERGAKGERNVHAKKKKKENRANCGVARAREEEEEEEEEGDDESENNEATEQPPPPQQRSKSDCEHESKVKKEERKERNSHLGNIFGERRWGWRWRRGQNVGNAEDGGGVSTSDGNGKRPTTTAAERKRDKKDEECAHSYKPMNTGAFFHSS